MIEIGDQTYALSDPLVLVVLGLGVALGVIIILLVVSLRATRRSSDPLIFQLDRLGLSLIHI